MGRQLNQIIEGLSGVTAGTSTINVNLDAIEALLTTLQADVADGIIVSSGTANTNLRDGAGNAITSSTRGSQRPLSVQILDSSGNQITSFGTSDVNAKLQDGSGNAITSTVSGSSRRLDVMLSSGGATGSAAPTNANLVGGTDGTNLRGLSVDSSGRLNTNINGTVPVSGTFWQATQPVSGTVTVNNQTATSGTATLAGNSASGTEILSSIDVGGFAEATVQLTSIASGSGTLQGQISNDNSTWVNTTVQNVAGVSTAAGNVISAAGMFRHVLLGARYFRIVVSQAGTGGTWTISYSLNPRATIPNVQSIIWSSNLSTTTVPSTAQGFTNHHTAISAASTNATNVKNSAANIGSIILVNTTASLRYFKLFNLLATPTMGTSTPVLNYAIQPNTTLAIDCGYAGIRLNVGLSYAITAGQALLDNTAVGAGDVVVNISYV